MPRQFKTRQYSFQQMVLVQLDIHKQKNEVSSLPNTNYKIYSKQIKDLSERVKTIKFLGENMGVNLCDLGLGSDFLAMTPKAQTTETKIGKVDCIKI